MPHPAPGIATAYLQAHPTWFAGLCHRYARDGALGVEAADLAQEVRIKAHLHEGDLYEGSNAQAWLTTVTRNVAINFARKHRKHRKHRASPIETSPEVLATPMPPDDSHDAEFVRASVAALGPHHARAIALHAEGYSYIEAAELMGSPISTYKSRLHDARKALAKSLVGSRLMTPRMCRYLAD